MADLRAKNLRPNTCARISCYWSHEHLRWRSRGAAVCSLDVKSRARFLLPLIYLGFISLGLPDGAFGVAWPAVYPDLNLPIGLAGTILTMGTIFASVSGFSSGWILQRWRAGPVVTISGFLTASGLLILSQAQGAWWLYIAAIPLGFGAGAVDASLNGYVARHYSGSHMNWLHACWGIGATCGPLFIGSAIAGGHGWRGGYLALGTVQLVLAILFVFTLGWWKHVPERVAHAKADGSGRGVPSMKANSFAGWLSPAIFAVYVAVEMTLGLWAGTVLVVGRGFSEETAAICTACFYAAITGGRILIGFVIERVGNRRLVSGGALLALASAIWFAWGAAHPGLAAGALMLAGLGFSPIYPGLMHEVPRRFAPEAVQTIIGRQSGAAGLGAAALPALAGAVAQQTVGGVPLLVVSFVVVLILCLRTLDRLT